MLQHLFLEAAEDYTTTGILPIFLELRYFTQETEMLQFIVETVSSKDESFTSEEAEKALYEGRCQLLMDGFDEIDPSDIDSFLKKINSFLDRYQKVQVIITSRENEYLTGLNQFIRLYVWPFDTEQSMQLIDRILTYQNQPDERDAIVDYIGKGFLKKDGIFASNPLLLTYVSMLYPNYRRFNESVLMNFVLKMVGEHIDYSFALHSSLVESIPENTEEMGKLIATVKEIERMKIIQIENKSSDLYEAIRISHKQRYDHSWITDTDQNLICFGKTVKVDSYDLCESPESFMEITNDIARQSNNTYNVFLKIENYYKQLKREQHRRRR